MQLYRPPGRGWTHHHRRRHRPFQGSAAAATTTVEATTAAAAGRAVARREPAKAADAKTASFAFFRPSGSTSGFFSGAAAFTGRDAVAHLTVAAAFGRAAAVSSGGKRSFTAAAGLAAPPTARGHQQARFKRGFVSGAGFGADRDRAHVRGATPASPIVAGAPAVEPAFAGRVVARRHERSSADLDIQRARSDEQVPAHNRAPSTRSGCAASRGSRGHDMGRS